MERRRPGWTGKSSGQSRRKPCAPHCFFSGLREKRARLAGPEAVGGAHRGAAALQHLLRPLPVEGLGIPAQRILLEVGLDDQGVVELGVGVVPAAEVAEKLCLLYTSDAADD